MSKIAEFQAMIQRKAGGLNNKLLGEMYTAACNDFLLGDPTLFQFMQELERAPVSIEEFMDSKEFLGATDFKIWPEVRAAIIAMKKDWWKGLSCETCYDQAGLGGATGTGKCLGIDTPIVMYDGSVKRVQDVQIGDLLMGPDSTPRRVLSLARGREEMFRVTPVQGDAYVVNRSHILSLKMTGMGPSRGRERKVHAANGQRYGTGDIADISVDDYLQSTSTFKHVAKGWRAPLVRFKPAAAALRVDPYFLGIWLGDGSVDAPKIHNPEPEIRDFVHAYAARLGLRVSTHDEERCPAMLINGGMRGGAENPLSAALRSYGLLTDTKFIPPEFLRGGDGDRWALLAGLLDTDGHLDVKSGVGYEITTMYPQLATDIKFLARSLGLSATSKIEEKFCQTGAGGLYTRVYISGDMATDLPIRVARKKANARSGAKDHALTGISLESIGEDDYYGFEINGDRRFLLGDFTVTHNTSIAITITMYDAYLLTCMRNPQAWYGLPKATSIVFAILAAKPHVMKKVIYAPMRKFIESMPYFQKYAMPEKLIESEILFKGKNIRVVPAGGDEDAVLGEAIIGSIADEINFMKVVLRSKKAEVTSGRSGMYDQATQVYTTLVRRKRGRFTRPGPSIGMTIPASSTRYKGDFMDKLVGSVRSGSLRNCYLYNRRQFDVQPKERFSGLTFRLLVANDIQHDTRVLEDDDFVKAGARVEIIPIEYLDDFKSRPYDAMRDVLGISSNVISPFIKQRYKVQACVENGKEQNIESFLRKDHVILGVDGMPAVLDHHYCSNPSLPRYVHIDLSRTGDRCAVAMLCFTGMRKCARESGPAEYLPTARVEMALTIEPDANNEIDIAEVRAFVAQLRKQYGYPIKGVSYDGFDSRESIQAWRKSGMRATLISVDRTEVPYKQLRDALTDERIDLPDDPVLLEELFDLEYDATKKKIDHPVMGCFTGDTQIALQDGSTVRFDAAVAFSSIPVMTFDSGAIAADGLNPRVTKMADELIELLLENGQLIRCTPEHRFLLKTGVYKEAQHLTELDDLQD